MTKVVGPLEIGKVLAVNGCIQVTKLKKHCNVLDYNSVSFQALMPFVTSPTFSLLYRSTVDSFPQAFLFLTIGVYVVVIGLVITIRWLETKTEKLKISDHENIEEN